MQLFLAKYDQFGILNDFIGQNHVFDCRVIVRHTMMTNPGLSGNFQILPFLFASEKIHIKVQKDKF